MRPVSFAAFLILGICAGSAVAQADNFAKLPAGPGRDVMTRVCSQCHSPEAAADQNLDAAGWRDLVATMKENGAQASDAEFATIVTYLSTAFPKK